VVGELEILAPVHHREVGGDEFSLFSTGGKEQREAEEKGREQLHGRRGIINVMTRAVYPLEAGSLPYTHHIFAGQ
jgi:hypothetical protein